METHTHTQTQFFKSPKTPWEPKFFILYNQILIYENKKKEK